MISLFLIERKITLQEKTFAGLVCNNIIFDQCVLSIAKLCLFASNLSKRLCVLLAADGANSEMWNSSQSSHNNTQTCAETELNAA